MVVYSWGKAPRAFFEEVPLEAYDKEGETIPCRRRKDRSRRGPTRRRRDAIRRSARFQDAHGAPASSLPHRTDGETDWGALRARPRRSRRWRQ